MTIAAVKQRLHEYIDQADAKKARAFLALIDTGDVKDIEETEKEYEFDDETVNMLEERLERYLSGESKGYTMEESLEHMKAQIRKK